MDSLDEGTGRLDEQLGVVRKKTSTEALTIFTFCNNISPVSGKITAAA